MSIELNRTEITIRPSSIISYQQCRRSWALVHLEGRRSGSNARAVVGTAVHKAGEVMWNEAIKTGEKDLNVTRAADCAVEEFDKLCKDNEPTYNGDDTPDSARLLVSNGAKVFMTDIAEYTDIPLFAEKRYAVPISDHPIVKEVGGTIDYISTNTIADIKTSKRTISPYGHVLQQSIYKYVAEENGHTIDYCLLQGVVFTKKPKGTIVSLEPNIPRAKYAVNNMLATLRAFYDGGDPDVLFPGNTGYYLCSQMYCGFYDSCKFVNGDVAPPQQEQIVL